MKRATLAALFAASLAPLVARADTRPNRWDFVLNPSLEASWRLHVYVRKPPRRSRGQRPRQSRRKARVLLEDAGAATSPDMRLRFNLGAACARLRDERCVIMTLEPALAAAPNDPAAGEAYDELAHSYAVLDDSVSELRICERYLPRVTEDRVRAILLLNCAEAAMHHGELSHAIGEYKEAIDVASAIPNVFALEDQTQALAMWGLAVALDRARDPRGAEIEAHLALRLDNGMQLISHGSNVFFSPERERYWYVALGFADYARNAEGAESRAALWARAEGCWREYVADVALRGKGDRWADLARARLASAHAARIAAERDARKLVIDTDARCVD